MGAATVSFDRLQGLLGRWDDDPLTQPDPDRQVWRTQALRRAVRHALTPVQQQTVELYYGRGLTMAEIAALRGCRPPTVCRTLQRARRNLRAVLRCLPAFPDTDV